MHIEKQKLGYGDMHGDDASQEVVREIARDPDVYTRLSQVCYCTVIYPNSHLIRT